LMKAFLITAGVVFGLIAAAHVARVIVEGPRLAGDPAFIVLTVIAAGLSAWAWRLVWTLDRPQ